jgi:hypothetical protein
MSEKLAIRGCRRDVLQNRVENLSVIDPRILNRAPAQRAFEELGVIKVIRLLLRHEEEAAAGMVLRGRDLAGRRFAA